MDSIQPILLNKGLDTVTPSPLTEPGTLVDCLNYEMTATAGYSRIDGYERYDGWTNGDIADYCYVTVTVQDGLAEASMFPGAIISNYDPAGNRFIYGTVMAYNLASKVITYIPANMDLPLIPFGATLSIDTYTNSQLTAVATAVKGSQTDSASTFIANVRTFSGILRGQSVDQSLPVCGLLWHRQNLVAAVDTWLLSVSDNAALGFSIKAGAIIDYQGYRYRVIYVTYDGSTSPGSYKMWMQRITTVTSVATPFVLDRATGSNLQLSTDTPTMPTAESDWATLSYLQTPDTAYSRGTVPLFGTYWVQFTGGKQINSADPKYGDTVYVKFGATANKVQARVITVQLETGSFASNNATGWYEIQIRNGSGVNYPTAWIETGDNLYSDVGLATLVATNTNTQLSRVAGTKRLRAHNTRYVGETYNFWGDEARIEGYIATGASRAAWVRVPNSTLLFSEPSNTDAPAPPSGFTNYFWGNLWTSADPAIDKPKYVAIHKGVRLALGFAKGSVILSVIGEPHNYSGFVGATEIATGDSVTGLIEAPGDALLVFGKRAIRRITGVVEADMGLETISGAAGCYDYTAYLVGSTPIFVGPNGINTLEQSSDYGDFVGQNLSYKVSTTLIDEIVADRANSALGGVAMAMPVRRKSQYRLWLGGGKMISLALTGEGPKIMYSKYGATNSVRVPLAWTSQMSDTGEEHLMVVWDQVRAQRSVSVTGVFGTTPNVHRIYELDKGWGFDGTTFAHRFDLAHLFPTKGIQTTTVEKVRLYGMSHGLSTLNIRTSGIETDFEQTFHSAVQDISLPASSAAFYPNMHPVTNIIDEANWGMGMKIRIEGTLAEGLSTTEPPHVCQMMNVFIRTEGALDA